MSKEEGMRVSWVMVFATAFLFSAGASSTNAGPVLSFTGVSSLGSEGSSPGGNRGWEFNVLPAGGVNVTHLSVYDLNADGLAASHDVGIWNSAGTLLTSGTISAGTANPLDVNGLFRLVDIPDLVLPQANNYVIGAYYPNLSDDFVNTATGLSVHASIQYTDKLFLLSTSGLTRPTTSFIGQPGYFGPSFEIGVVPEPSTLVLFATTAICVLGYRWRRRRNRPES